MTDLIDIISILDPDSEEATRRPIDEDKLKDVFVRLQDVINNELVSVNSTLLTGDDTFNEIRIQNASGDLIGRILYQENKSFGQTQVTGIFLQENTGTNDSPVWADRYAFDIQSSGALHLNINGSAIVFPDGSTISSDHFNSSGEVNRYKGNDLDTDADGSVDQADDADTVDGEHASAFADATHGQSAHLTDSVGQNEIAAGSVGRSEVKTSTASSSGSGTGPAFSVNAYSFAVAIQGRYSSVDQNRNITVQRGADDANNYNGAHADTPYFYPDGPDAWEGSWRYLQSSPPYDLGDGRVGAFVYLDVEKNDGIRSVWIAEDPPWYGIGTRFVNGQPHYIEPSGPSFDQVRSGEITPREWSESTPGLNRTPVSDDPHRYKHRRPSPFPRTDNVALLDPSCDLCHELFLRHVELAGMPDEPNLTEILRDGYFEIKKDVTDQRNASIPGVSIVEGAWK